MEHTSNQLKQFSLINKEDFLTEDRGTNYGVYMFYKGYMVSKDYGCGLFMYRYK